MKKHALPLILLVILLLCCGLAYADQAPLRAQRPAGIAAPDLALDNEAMFAQYVDRLFNPSLTPRRSPDDVLTSELSRTMFAKWTMPTMQAIAAGSITSTEFVFAYEDMEDLKLTIEASELGLDSMLEGDDFSDAALDAAIELADERLQFTDQLDAMMLLDPAAMYWYDKTAGTAVGFSLSGTSDSITIEAIFISFSVSQDYAAGEYMVDTSLISRANKALNNVNSILDRYAGMSFEAQTEGYLQEICDLASYDFNAADDSIDTPYGDPWQLISVFDGDDSTNVVCEGYAKAYKYLFDKTPSLRAAAACCIVTGIMDGGTGAGRHMWNIIHMNSGMNYLVDVTNCDEHTVGAPRMLFMATPDGGSLEGGYWFTCNGVNVTYVYDDSMLRLYGAEVLALDGDPVDNGEWIDGYYLWVLDQETCVLLDAENAMTNAVLPEQLGDWRVIGIDAGFGYNLTGVVTIPATYTFINDANFSKADALIFKGAKPDCTAASIALKSEALVVYPLKEKSSWAPQGETSWCGALMVSPDANKVLVLPADLDRIDADAFSGTAPSIIILPERHVTIENGAFAANSLQMIHLPSTIEAINGDPFGGNHSIAILMDQESDVVTAWANANGYVIRYLDIGLFY